MPTLLLQRRIVYSQDDHHEIFEKSHATIEQLKGVPQRPVGPHESRYQEKFADYVETLLKKHRGATNRDGRPVLENYRALSPSKQRRQQEDVMQLLSRLGISNNSHKNASRKEEKIANESDSETRLDDNEDDASLTRLEDTEDEEEQLIDDKVEDSSMALLSPSPQKDVPSNDQRKSRQASAPSLPIHRQHPSSSSSLSSSSSPLEVARRADPPTPPSQQDNHMFSSPQYYSHNNMRSSKRLASTSGKRGMDTVRPRLVETPTFSNNSGGGDANPSPMSSSVSTSFIQSASPSSGHKYHHSKQQQNMIFSSSPSPISHHSTNSCLFDVHDHDDEEEEDHLSQLVNSRNATSTVKENVSRRQHSSAVQRLSTLIDDSIETVDETMIGKSRGYRRRWQDEPGAEDFLLRDRSSTNLVGPSRRYNDFDNNRVLSACCYFPPLTLHPVPSRRGGGGGARLPHDKIPVDPISSYPEGVVEQLQAVFQHLVSAERITAAPLRGKKPAVIHGRVVASLEYKQIIDVTMKLLLGETTTTTSGKKRSSPKEEEQQNQQDMYRGQTLVVVRTKDDLDRWARALRESTSLSVVNHATLALGERKRPAIASTCASFDVVLTTFDAMKSPDVVVAVNDNGHVLLSKENSSSSSSQINRGNNNSNSSSSWMTSRRYNNNGSQSQAWSGGSSDQQTQGQQQQQPPQRCKQLCVLHQIMWQRIVFVDELGRKSYLAKPDTARALAAVAFHGFSRIIFFPKVTQQDDSTTTKKQSTCAWDALAKSDRNVFSSLAAILRMPPCDNAVEDFVKIYVDAAQFRRRK